MLGERFHRQRRAHGVGRLSEYLPRNLYPVFGLDVILYYFCTLFNGDLTRVQAQVIIVGAFPFKTGVVFVVRTAVLVQARGKPSLAA